MKSLIMTNTIFIKTFFTSKIINPIINYIIYSKTKNSKCLVPSNVLRAQSAI